MKYLIPSIFLFSQVFGQTTGEAALESSASNEWQNWTFAAASAVSAASAVVLVAINSGKDATSSH